MITHNIHLENEKRRTLLNHYKYMYTLRYEIMFLGLYIRRFKIMVNKPSMFEPLKFHKMSF